MIAQALPWMVLLLGCALLARACRGLAADARGGFEISMGGAMLFSQRWLFGAAACAWGITALLGLPWWAGLLVFAALVVLKSGAYRIVHALFLGRSLPAPTPKSGGFSAFVERSKTLDAQGGNGDASRGPNL
jgi:hypothetical protein